ncbi:acyl carrier protein [Campylobacter lari]|uniref:acyl carrier protein n=1 Tax=Campylobacter lari TaxID=201 RepID=UPI00127A3762|nr:acyl carrier protein [Campylobacter lari]EAK0437084.1 acyl carrier protein [Campylobacter lari]EAL9772799.1 acyl carrier protein [Campylobacter lari]MBT0822399.1 acyl carrier protein [Campylobacter lari]MBT0830517.1 acyl carrier protein [Campylobacter lari]
MKKDVFLNSVEEILSIPKNSLLEDDILENFQDWDSIAFFELSVLIDKEFNLKIKPEDIKKFISVRDILSSVGF